MWCSLIHLHVLLISMGSARDVIPPWGGDARLGDRVLRHVQHVLNDRRGQNKSLGEDTIIEHSVTILDPITIFDPKDGPLGKISSVRSSCVHKYVPFWSLLNLNQSVNR